MWMEKNHLMYSQVEVLRCALRIEDAYKDLRALILEDERIRRAWSDLYQVSYTTGVGRIGSYSITNQLNLPFTCRNPEGAGWLHRFFSRRLLANPDQSLAHMAIANHSLVSSTYTYALAG
jgi:hypothetical protein